MWWMPFRQESAPFNSVYIELSIINVCHCTSVVDFLCDGERIAGDRPEGPLHTRFLRKLIKRIYCILINPSFIHLECLHGNWIFVSQRWAFRVWKVHSAPYNPPVFLRTTSLKFSMHRLPNLSVLLMSTLLSLYQWQDRIDLWSIFSVTTQTSVLPWFLKNIKYFKLTLKDAS
jgi:hypothetical protein